MLQVIQNQTKGSFRGNNQFSNLSPIQRFRQKVEIGGETDCWEWIGAKIERGYGSMKYNGKIQKAHRISYQIYHGPLSSDWDVLHSCDNPKCVNPFHLKKGTHMDNMMDMISKGRCFLTKGTRNGNSKLDDIKVRYIRIYRRIPTKELSKKFGVACSTINMIKNGTSWKKTG